MKKTAVEWLVEQLDGENHLTENEIKRLIQQALNMEKMQIIHSWDNGFANGYDLGKFDDECTPEDAQQYYDETFKSE